MLASSVLDEKAKVLRIRDIERASPQNQLGLYRITLAALEDYLDTGDLRMLTDNSLRIINDDILRILKGLRSLNPRPPVGVVSSMDGILENIRDARDAILIARGMFKLDRIDESKSSKFFYQLRFAREHIATAMRYFVSIL